VKEATINAARMPIIEMTTRSSIRVKPFFLSVEYDGINLSVRLLTIVVKEVRILFAALFHIYYIGSVVVAWKAAGKLFAR